jgi:hypothetical protein
LGLPNQPPQSQGHNPLASFGYTQGPNGELVPIMLRQGMNPYQTAPTGYQSPGYNVGLLGG